ncbi:MAG: hypothetical protein M1838_001688 [Thelocarpon superellum]|nr:MAG: hypothetical protein M1838_001688 [Thelocarpon superellum]
MSHIPHRGPPPRSNTEGGSGTEDDPSDTSSVLTERVRAWRHAVSFLETYMAATEKMHKGQAKEYEKVAKTIQEPLREGHHFDQSLGGIGGMFENIKLNTQGIANTHTETEKNIRVSVLPIVHRLQDELKSRDKELNSGAAKGFKAVTKARVNTQTYLDLLKEKVDPSAGSGSDKVDPMTDPYVIHRGIYYRLNKQIIEENSNRQEMLAAQDSFREFEAHVVQVMQQAMTTFVQFAGGQADRTKSMYGDMLSTTQHVPLDFEWTRFVSRSGSSLMDPNMPPRDVGNVSFAHQNHAATQPLIEGTLERKSRMLMKSYSSGYYVVTKARYLHEYKDTDNFKKDPTPELSLHLPDCTVGSLDGSIFTVKGKDASKGKIGIKMSTTHELSFKASSPQDAERWWQVIRSVSGGSTTGSTKTTGSGSGSGSGSSASSPVVQRQNTSGTDASPPPTKPSVQTQGITGEPTTASPTTGEKAYATPAEKVHFTPVEKNAPMPTSATATPAAGAPSEEKEKERETGGDPAQVAAQLAVASAGKGSTATSGVSGEPGKY